MEPRLTQTGGTGAGCFDTSSLPVLFQGHTDNSRIRHSRVGIDYRHLQKREMILCEQCNSPFLSLDPKALHARES